jgi:hypothetical protein
MIREGDEDYARWVKFLELLAENPSSASREHLFTWLAGRDFAITPEGHLLGYKGVRDDPQNTSVHPGTTTVNGVEHTGHIPNPVGAVIEMPRAKVSGDREVGCSTGLHVGTYAYAKGWGQRLLLVAVNPADVVSVPRDAEFQKMRVSRYKVLAVHDGPPVPAPSFDLPDEEEPGEEEDYSWYDEDDLAEL